MTNLVNLNNSYAKQETNAEALKRTRLAPHYPLKNTSRTTRGSPTSRCTQSASGAPPSHQSRRRASTGGSSWPG